ncbi:hypothetical protein E3O55_07155 [Cryobacterium sp. MDB1-18-2]|uniref:hypothetical protein n=1 Tax=unclassified Cryobacterium TaxID=2649013 RepID=UPI00106CC3A5|nr:MULTISPECIES: hypothetical protein [unclassified Cryobacterium]TFC30755.1 hypothetical protein E3O55_07155 [Cryobacterium sp. MDB1-18-2]TFC38098.1 hypothetical protein E3O50_16875 [Cryobacterium sp. MDB1-18-1]
MSTTTPTPTASTTVPAGQTRPVGVFGGTCDALFTVDEVSAAVGAVVTSSERARAVSLVLDPSWAAVPARGGIDCLWSENESLTGAYFSAVVLAAASVTTVHADEVYCYGADVVDPAQSGSCRVSATDGGYWLSAVVYTAVGTINDDTRTAVATLLTTFSGRARAAGTPVAVVTPSGAWKREDCAALSDTAHVTDAISSPGLTVSSADTASGEAAEGRYAALGSAGVFACSWSQSPAPAGQIESFSIILLPGGSWAQEDVARETGAETVSIPGVDLVTRIPNEAGGYTFDAFDGVNWLRLSTNASTKSDLDQLTPAIPALVNALNAA